MGVPLLDEVLIDKPQNTLATPPCIWLDSPLCNCGKPQGYHTCIFHPRRPVANLPTKPTDDP